MNERVNPEAPPAEQTYCVRMTPSISPRRTAAAITLLTAGALLLPAAPASAAPAVDGDLGAFAYGKTNVSGCTAHPGPVNEQKTFSSTTGKRTAEVARSFRGENSGIVSARGRVENSTSGVADADNGAFDTATFTAQHLVRINDTEPSLDCHLGSLADSQSSAVLKVKHNGKVRVEWDRGSAGQIEQIFVSRNGNTILDKMRPSAHGSASFHVHAGTYNVFVQFQTRVNETDIPAGTTLTKHAHFKVVLDYHH
jgi:hypothetical protein